MTPQREHLEVPMKAVFGLPKQLEPMLIAAVAVGCGIVILTKGMSVEGSFSADTDGIRRLAEFLAWTW